MSESILKYKTAKDVAKLFKPMFEAIDVCNLNVNDCKYVRLSDVLYAKYGLERCVVLVKYSSDFPKNHYGLCITSYIEEDDIFFFQIILNSDLSTESSCIKRKSVFIHEFLHVVATLLALTEVGMKTLKQRLIKKLESKVTLITEELLAKVVSTIRKSNTNDNAQKNFDSHFRLGWENFQDSYFTLFEEFMLSEKEFETVFTEKHKKDFCEVLKTVSDKYHIDIAFVRDRFFNTFINTYML